MNMAIDSTTLKKAADMFKKLKRSFGDLPIKHKIMVFYLPLSLIPILLFAIVSNNIYRNTIINRTFNSAMDNSVLIINQVEDVLQDAENCANRLTININTVVQRYITDGTPTQRLSLYNALSNELSFSLLIFDGIDSIAFIDTNHSVYSTHAQLHDNNQSAYDSSMMQQLEQTTGKNLWFEMEKRNYLTRDPSTPVLTLGKKVIQIKTGKTLGYLFVNLREDTLSTIFEHQYSTYSIVDDNQRVIASNLEDYLLKPVANSRVVSLLKTFKNYSGIQHIDKRDMLLTILPFNTMQWKLIGTAMMSDMTKDLSQLTIIMILFIIAAIISQMLGSRLLSYVIITPLSQLAYGMKKIGQGSFDITFKVNTKDETGVLACGFNKMAHKIKELLNKVKKEQKKKREYELALIQEQIKPHFLYNCLDVIYTLVEMGRNKDAGRATKALADYYRVTLSKGRDIITIEEEIKNVKDYLALQQIRYYDVFEYNISIDACILNKKIIKLTLQPIVENAIYHGLKPSGTFGKITLSGTLEADAIRIIVKDNGVGIPKKILDNLLTNTTQKTHYGLYSVQDRIKLFFGKTYGLTIKSKEGEGTEVILTLPIDYEVTLDD